LIASRGESSSQATIALLWNLTAKARHCFLLAAPAPAGSLDYVSATPARRSLSLRNSQPSCWMTFSAPLALPTPTSARIWLKQIRNSAWTFVTTWPARWAENSRWLSTARSSYALVESDYRGQQFRCLQLAMEKMVQAANREAQKSNMPGLTLNQTQSGGRTFYTIQSQSAGLSTEYNYTFADGT